MQHLIVPLRFYYSIFFFPYLIFPLWLTLTAAVSKDIFNVDTKKESLMLSPYDIICKNAPNIEHVEKLNISIYFLTEDIVKK
jgi:hypothetical protein